MSVMPWEYQTEAEMVQRFLNRIPESDRNLVLTPQQFLPEKLPSIDESVFHQRAQGYGGWVWNDNYRLLWIQGILPSWKDMTNENYRVLKVPSRAELHELHQAIARHGLAAPFRTGHPPLLALLVEAGTIVVRPVYEFDDTDLQCSSGNRAVTPYLSIPRERFFLRDELAEFEAILNADAPEAAIQKFLAGHHHFLQALGYSELRQHVVLRRSNQTELIPDFIGRPLARDFWDILELKAPVRTTVVHDRSSSSFSASVYRGINQLKEYSEYFDDEVQRRWFEAENGVKIVKPGLVLLVGSHGSPSPLTLQLLRGRSPDVRIVTYEELLATCARYLLY